ncbi:MBL fold metallo-hydrolase [Clostridiaceae bacterium UIB06]|uniref:MBL fold metallo-hydrolase n=1 Tax=Clostridium thailandense TaxID=2794346 RepID=A0A949THB4_9CLOT|nr:MBL fold metallo-hydrolase [Clostridium thailandense]MBV7272235.1 MBL fold metallo-hydrolase [Clostridium thailandense]MCH5137781.1 MBL fold metallo-hydrolase [Clostridiaceae bacterium UIB06]
MKVSFLGGAHEVGGSCILVKVCDKNILLDCGIRQSASKDPLPDFRTIQECGGIDAIIISHAHLDHIGSLPLISKEYPNARIYTNNMTKDLMKVLLYDSLKIMNNREAEIPLYAELDVENMLNRIFTINYMVELPIFEGINLTFYIAGHIAGAACVYITTADGSLFYSGDFSIFAQSSVEGLKVPKLRPDVAIFETTYGDRLHSNREVEEERLIQLVRECEINKGKMLIPAFALGRAQEILLILKKAINKKIIKGINIYVDGMIKDINRVYKLNPVYLRNSLAKKILKGVEPFYDDNIIPVDKKELREKIAEDKEACIIVASSGMITGGPSQYYAEKLASMERAYIVITGYQDEESPGRKLLNLLDSEERILEINGRSIPVRCKIEKVGLSAHGDKGEIKSLVNLLSPNNIFLVHGDGEIIEGFASELSSEVRGKIYAPKCGETYDINIRNPRKQWKKQMPNIIKSSEELNETNLEVLWRFVLENYSQRLFTVEDLIYIWSGNNKIKQEDIEKTQRLIMKCVYFETDLRRLFLFKAKTSEQVEEDTKERELKPNELNELVNEYFYQYAFKKAGLIYEEKKVSLSFDFPYVIDKSIYEVCEKFEGNTGWKVEISNKVNINAVEDLMREFLYDADIKKISFRLEDKNVIAILNSEFLVEKQKLEEFKEKTGLDLFLQNPGINIEKNLSSIIEAEDNAIEQNQALKLIDESFAEEEFKPYKKGVKSNGNRKYIELYFISPMIGERYKSKIKDLVSKTGWSMKISEASNQNEIIRFAAMLCKKTGINLKKNPSFNASELSVELKAESLEKDKIESIREEFEYKTGFRLKG